MQGDTIYDFVCRQYEEIYIFFFGGGGGGGVMLYIQVNFQSGPDIS